MNRYSTTPLASLWDSQLEELSDDLYNTHGCVLDMANGRIWMSSLLSMHPLPRDVTVAEMWEAAPGIRAKCEEHVAKYTPWTPADFE